MLQIYRYILLFLLWYDSVTKSLPGGRSTVKVILRNYTWARVVLTIINTFTS